MLAALPTRVQMMPLKEEKKRDIGDWILGGFFLALGGFLFELARVGGRKLVESRADDDEYEEIY